MLAYLSYDPIVSIDVGPLSVSPHGIMTAVAVLVGARLLLPQVRRAGLDADAVVDVVTKAVFAAIIGARLAYVFNHFDSYAGRPLDIARVWEGGLSLLGGLAAAGAVGAVVARRRGLPVVRLLDLAVPAIAVGIAVGRIGDLVIADHLGKPTDFFLGYVCPTADTGSPCVAAVGEAVHQTALYDMAAAALIGIVLFRLRRRQLRQGTLALTFGLLYGAARFVEGFYRIDVTHGTGLNGSQWTALAVAVASAVTLTIVSRRSTPGSDAARRGLGTSPVHDDGPHDPKEAPHGSR
jgi:phosphatidylglycerol:prolipoprotein diacylglycerol transferase